MKNLNAIIVDDEEKALNLLEKLLIETEQIEILEKISDPLKVECLTAKHKPDVLFLDIQMPAIDGIKILKNIREYNQDLVVVYITAYDKYGIEALKLNAYDYLIKPVDRKELKALINKLFFKKKKLNNTYNEKIKLSVKNGIIYVKLADVLYLKADGNYTEINLVSGDKYLSSYNMGRLVDKFNLKGFERINRNLSANSEYIYKIDRENKTCELKTDTVNIELPISKTFLQNLKNL
ncbi:MAG: LytTR family DNA-binding domain-containing protein [Bacteroidales bacterium]|jgi:two-component system LytT family response regulator|nr:LytTR family DNA-binding domain-containing protein [Bacteroidales bacterium]